MSPAAVGRADEAGQQSLSLSRPAYPAVATFAHGGEKALGPHLLDEDATP